MAIADLSKWDFALEFMLYEAAALIVGLEPAEIFISTGPAKDNDNIYDYHEHPQLKPVVDRMKFDYFAGQDLYFAFSKGKWSHPSPAPQSESVLRSREMEIVPLHITIECFPLDQAVQDILNTWYISDEEKGTYETAKFTRLELSRWLKAIGMKSKYEFHTAQAAPKVSDTGDLGRWPWGNHHTELLGHLDATARRFWVNYDPSDATTAPTKVTVSDWLKTERKVSGQMADSIASILRPDGLPTGPRK